MFTGYPSGREADRWSSYQRKAGDVTNSGPCSLTSNWNLKASPDNAALDVEAEVDTNVVGQTWSWKIADNGSRVANGHDTKVAPSGSFTVRRTIADLAGTDHIVFKASNPDMCETCRGKVSI